MSENTSRLDQAFNAGYRRNYLGLDVSFPYQTIDEAEAYIEGLVMGYKDRNGDVAAGLDDPWKW